ncbi:MAG TPA: hypothetical protein VEI02_00005, partial [Planctomycetota bacterium]|nr:hypothetical protein [Planctomycetota bacterium]
MIRGVAAVIHVASLRVTRGALVAVVPLAFAGMLASFPPLDALGRAAGWRQGASYAAEAWTALVGAAAVACALRRPA